MYILSLLMGCPCACVMTELSDSLTDLSDSPTEVSDSLLDDVYHCLLLLLAAFKSLGSH